MRTDLSFEEIYGQHKDMVYNLCLNYLQNLEDAAEATQDVFVKVHEKRAAFEGKSSMKTWIYRITVHQCLDFLKARKRQKRFGFVTSLFGGQNRPEIEVPDFNHPGVQLEDKEALESIFQQINSLTANQKSVIVLKYLDDLPQQEIADILQLSVKAVESLLQRAKQNLGKKLPRSKDNGKNVVQSRNYENAIATRSIDKIAESGSSSLFADAY